MRMCVGTAAFGDQGGTSEEPGSPQPQGLEIRSSILNLGVPC